MMNSHQLARTDYRILPRVILLTTHKRELNDADINLVK